MGANGVGYSHSTVLDVALTDSLNYVLQSDLVTFDPGAAAQRSDISISTSCIPSTTVWALVLVLNGGSPMVGSLRVGPFLRLIPTTTTPPRSVSTTSLTPMLLFVLSGDMTVLPKVSTIMETECLLWT